MRPKTLLTLSLQLAVGLAVAVGLPPGYGGEGAAPSSHLVFDDNFAGDILIQEVRVPRDGEQLHTYYEVLGWRGTGAGYAGVQAHARGHNYIFSIWDHEAHAAPIRAVHRGPGTLTEEFGGEGTGLKSWNFELGWETDTWYTLVARCWPVGEQTHYGFWSRSGKTGVWTHLVTMDVAAPRSAFEGGTDAFLEDWLETGELPRTTHLRGGWRRRQSGEWHPFGSGRYSVNAWDLEPGKRSYRFRTAWDAGIAKDATGSYYFMTAGGPETRPSTGNPSTLRIPRDETRPGYEPLRISTAKLEFPAADTIVVSWEPDPRSLPQFGVHLVARQRGDDRAPAVAEARVEDPALRRLELKLPTDVDRQSLEISLTLRDILDHETPPFPLQTR